MESAEPEIGIHRDIVMHTTVWKMKSNAKWSHDMNPQFGAHAIIKQFTSYRPGKLAKRGCGNVETAYVN